MITIVVNRNAGGYLKDPSLGLRLQSILGDQGTVIETRSEDEIPATLTHILQGDSEILAISGGDGTYHHVLTQLYDCCRALNRPFPTILPLPGGTMNNLPVDLGLKRNAERILKKLVRLKRTGRKLTFVHRDTLLIENRIGFLFGTAFSARITEAYRADQHRGMKKVLKLMTAFIISSLRGKNPITVPVTAAVELDGQMLDFPYHTGLLLGTISKTGFGFTLLARGLEKDGTFHVIYTNFKPLRMLPMLACSLFGKSMARPGVIDQLGQHLVLNLPNPEPYVFDGDIYYAQGRLEVELGPQIRFVTV